MGRSTGPFWLRSIRRRPVAVVVLAALAALATAVSVLAPLLLRAVEQTALSEALSAGGLSHTAVTASAEIQPSRLPDAQDAVLSVTNSIVHGRLWQQEVVVAETKATATWTPRGTAGTAGTARTGGASPIAGVGDGCRRLTLVTGHCPGTDQVLLPAGSDVRVGTPLDLALGGTFPVRFRATVVGTYDPTTTVGRITSAPDALFGAGGSTSPDVLVSLDTFGTRELEGSIWSVRPLARAIDLDDLPLVRSDLRVVDATALSPTGASEAVDVQTGLGGLLDDVADGRRDATVVVAVTALQAVLLAWFAEAVLVSRIGRARAAEWGLARLRGLPRRRRIGTVLIEPSVAVLVGSVVGIGLGLGTAALTAPSVLGAVALEPFRAPVVLTVVAAVVGSAGALVVASARSARLPLADLLRRTTEPRTTGRTAAVVQASGVVLAVTVLAAVVTQQQITGPGVALLAPTLVAVLLGLIALRVAVWVLRRRADRPARTLAGVLVLRRLARTPSALTTAVMVTVGVSVALSTCQTAVLAVRLQDDRARATTGAATVLKVDVPDDVSFIDAVHRADPSGRQAMAVEHLDGGVGVGRLLAVDTTRFAAVSASDSSWTGRTDDAVRRSLAPAHGPSLTLHGDRLALTLDHTGAIGGSTAPSFRPDTTDVAVTVQNASGWHRLTLGEPRDGILRSGPGTLPCADGCRLVWIGLLSTDPEGQAYGAATTITRIATSTGSGADRAVSSDWLSPRRWQDRVGSAGDASSRPTGTVFATDDGLRVSWADPAGGGSPSIAPRDAPQLLPVLIGAASRVLPFPGIEHAVSGIGLDGQTQVLGTAGRVPSLPRLLDDGAMADLGVAGRLSDPSTSVADHEVWLTPGSHPAVLAALRADGVQVTGTRTLAAAERHAERHPVTLAAVLGVPVAAVALLLTVLAVLAVGLVGAATRSTDLAALRSAGVDGRRTRRALVLGAFLPTAMGTALGAVAGTLATLLIADRLPLRDGAAPPVGLLVGPGPVLATVVGSALLLLVTAVLTARAEQRAGGAS